MCGGDWAERDLVRQCADLRDFQGRDTALHGLLQLLEGVHLDLAHALARNAELVRQLVERDRLVPQSARLEYATLSLVQYCQRVAQRLVAGGAGPSPPPPSVPPCRAAPPPDLPPPRCALLSWRARRPTP